MTKENKKPEPRRKLPDEVLHCRCLKKDKTGMVVETLDQMYRRVADTIAAVEGKYGATNAKIKPVADEFYDYLSNVIFLPNSSILMNAGRDKGMLSACFVLPIEDNIEGIFETVKNTARIQKAGGGTGFSFDELRPTGDWVASSGGQTSGPISFWRVLSQTTEAIQQGAFRRGANMAMMSLWHPDILKFLVAKQDPKAFNNFNVSVKVTDDWMRILQENPTAPHVVRNPRTGEEYYLPCALNLQTYQIDNLVAMASISPSEITPDQFWTIGDLWQLIITQAHRTGEPGICFIDRVNQNNPTPHLGPIAATNPCGEQPLLSNEACILGSIDISKFVLPDGKDMNWFDLEEVVDAAVRFLDNAIDANSYLVSEIERTTLGNRKIGLGVMGFADALVLRGIRYNSQEALYFADDISLFLRTQAHKASEALARERGCFPNWPGSIWDTQYHRPMRNAAVTTIAPTGTLSLIAGCSSGIEPIYSLATNRRALDGQEFIYLHPLLEKLGKEGGWLTPQIRQQLVEGMAPAAIAGFPRPLAEVLVTAHEIAPAWHVKIQAACQAHVDNGVSKTVNMPANATLEDVDQVYRSAFALGCKGITVYRDGCRKNQVLTSAHTIPGTNNTTILPRPRPRTTNGHTTKFRMGCGTLFVCVNKDEQGLAEVFASLGKQGGCGAQTEATCRAISISLRSGVDPKILVEQLKGIRCLSTITRRKEDKDIDVVSCPHAISRALEEAIGQSYEPAETSTANPCPECKYPLRREAGCNVCDHCGYTKCG